MAKRNCKLIARQYKWDNELQALIEIPLDDSCTELIDFARETAGKMYTDDEAALLLDRLYNTDI